MMEEREVQTTTDSDLLEAGDEELALVTSKMKGEVSQVKEDKPKKPAAKSMMDALREAAES
jgi:hypothetical protein